MDGGTIHERAEVIRELKDAADDFAERALGQEARRDCARPGTGAYHQFAHSATLWRTAELRLRTRITELELESAGRSLPFDVSAMPRLTRTPGAGHPAA